MKKIEISPKAMRRMKILLILSVPFFYLTYLLGLYGFLEEYKSRIAIYAIGFTLMAIATLPVVSIASEADENIVDQLEFKISGKELIEARNFQDNHKCKLGGKKPGVSGGRYSYKFTPTTIGMAVAIKCACGQAKDVTDYDSW